MSDLSAAMFPRQSQRKPREPMQVFLAKGVTFAAVIALAVIWLALHFGIGFSPQKIISLPWRAWVVHKGDRTVTRNEYVAFYTDGRMSAYFPPGTHFIKRVVGMPSDHVVVKHGVVIVNDQPITKLYLAKALGKSKADFSRDFIVDKGHYWVMGISPFSYDSRYWGTISQRQVIGRGYPIW